MTLTYVPSFVAKTQAVGKPVRRQFTLHALSEHTDDPEELLLCPVRALKYYLWRIEALELSPKRLFVAPKCPSKSISKNAASFFIKSVIVDSHKRENLPSDICLKEIDNVRAYDIRAMSISHNVFLTGSLEAILQARIWHCPTMFPLFYLRDVTLEFPSQGYFALRNDLRVVAQSVVSRSRGLLVPLGPRVVVSPSGTKERKDKRSKVKSSSKGPSQRSSSLSLFSSFDKIREGSSKH